MNALKICVYFVLILTINLNVCNAASLPIPGNDTVGTNEIMAKTSTTIMDVFEDIRWFFDRLTIFCDLVEKMLPPERKERQQPQLTVGISLQNGLRHFVVGIREISKSIVRVVSDKDVQEYKQLSRATDFAHDLVKSVGDFFRNLRILVGDIFAAYTFYIPEVLLTKCMANYLIQTYPHRHLYEYPILLINDVIDSFRTPVTFENEDVPTNDTDNERKFGSGTEINFDKNMEQNEILDEDLYVFHNTPVSPTPELSVKTANTAPDNESSLFNLGGVLNDKWGLRDNIEAEIFMTPSWKKCAQIYATETIFRKLELYFLIRE